MEEGLFGPEEEKKDKRYHVLVIYDIADTKQRNQLARYLSGYGFRVQKSAFEAILSNKKYHQLIEGLGSYAKTPDSIRVYKWSTNAKITQFGKVTTIQDNTVFII